MQAPALLSTGTTFRTQLGAACACDAGARSHTCAGAEGPMARSLRWIAVSCTLDAAPAAVPFALSSMEPPCTAGTRVP